jgi:hypothetical protein
VPITAPSAVYVTVLFTGFGLALTPNTIKSSNTYKHFGFRPTGRKSIFEITAQNREKSRFNIDDSS